jgi:glucans biosynthesis protein C
MTHTVNTERRYDIDWLRTIAIFLLIIYHAAIVFQPWANYIWFIQSEQTSEEIWWVMGALNIWRIPLLFLVSGMGVAFAMQRRTWLQLIGERCMRILLPLMVGIFAVVPVHIYLYQSYQGLPLEYTASQGHLWFLNYLAIFLSIFIAIFYGLNKHRDSIKAKLEKVPATLGLAFFMLPAVGLIMWVNPDTFSAYAATLHGLIYGGFCFLLGFLIIFAGNKVKHALQTYRFWLLGVAFVMYLARLLVWELQAPNWFNAIESMTWLYAILGLAAQYLNRPSRVLNYLSSGVYPMYIVHMAALYASCFWVLPLNLDPALALLLLTLSTLIPSLVFYEIMRRIPWVRKLFGIR